MAFFQVMVSVDDVWDSIPLPMSERELETYLLCGGTETIQSPGFCVVDVNCAYTAIENVLRQTPDVEIHQLNRLAKMLSRASKQSVIHYILTSRVLKDPVLSDLIDIAEHCMELQEQPVM